VLSNVESAYGPIKAIRGVSLKVRQGEIATVLGSNGAGKTTILKTISGIIDPNRGSVHFKGDDITARDPAAIVRLGLSHVPEGREVFPLLSVHDNLLMGAYTRSDRDGVARDIERRWATSRSCASASARMPACCRAASSRCWRSRARWLPHRR
jgi:branched-chain amino acid transport system ATP-binding protein